jgi:hypothetical protein
MQERHVVEQQVCVCVWRRCDIGIGMVIGVCGMRKCGDFHVYRYIVHIFSSGFSHSSRTAMCMLIEMQAI